jgi:hypothetical protein
MSDEQLIKEGKKMRWLSGDGKIVSTTTSPFDFAIEGMQGRVECDIRSFNLPRAIQFSFDGIKLGLSGFPILGLFTEVSERLHRSLKGSFRIVDVSGTNLRVVGFLTYLAKSAHQP